MAITHVTAVRNGIADYVVDQLDVGATNPSARIIFQTSGDVTVATLPMSNPAFGAASAGVATAAAITSDTNAVGGTIAKFVAHSRAAAIVLSGTVTATGGGGDIQLSSLVIGAGDTVQLTSLTYTAPV